MGSQRKNGSYPNDEKGEGEQDDKRPAKLLSIHAAPSCFAFM